MVTGSGIQSRNGDESHAAKDSPVQCNRFHWRIIRHFRGEEPGRLHSQSAFWRSRIVGCPRSPLSTIEVPREDSCPPQQEPAVLPVSCLGAIEHHRTRVAPAGYGGQKIPPDLVHVISTISSGATDARGKRPGIDLGRKGCAGSVGRRSPHRWPGLSITREYVHVRPGRTVRNRSCPSLGRRKGGAVPPVTHWPPFCEGENHGRGESNWQFESGGSC